MGVKKTITKPGGGVVPKKGDTIEIHYTGKLTDGSTFDSSLTRGSPFVTEIGTGRVIKGWDAGILGQAGDPPMRVGEEATLTISSDFGYGARGFPPVIPPNSELIFDVQLLRIIKTSQKEDL
ncbi:FK506-binding protein 1A [Drechslerella stenobrocha 248]|uniref:peptidylprolyl isomerase n=1 Tax=Drechslerella stenobrocha 248 TaxID=1043628 RepID=W7HTR3_9PEZI|nr:FK506-binding protein 1A [Drechslerella stenobrocha 248]